MPGGRRARNADNRGAAPYHEDITGRSAEALICIFALVMLISMPTPGPVAPAPAAAPVHAGPDPLGLEIADVVSRLRRSMRRAARATGRDGKLPGGLSVAQLELLSCLADSPGARPSQLARLLRLAPSSVATLVHGLRRAGLVSRTGGQRDRRTASLLLTPDGTAVVGYWQEINEQILQAAI